MSSRTPTLFSAALLFSILGSTATAQVTIQMTTAPVSGSPSTNCTATTDGAGLQLVPGSTDLKATGVVLNPAGCGSGRSDDFAASVSVPGNAGIGSAFNVTWAASQDATACTYGGGPATGISGWNFGALACTGATCAGTHIVPVTASTSGNYNFSVTCTNSTGYANGAIAVANTTPPTPNPFTITAPSSVTVGTPFSVSWSVSNATACDATATLNGANVELVGWTDIHTVVSPRSVAVPSAGTYVLSLVCRNTYGQATGQPVTVTASSSGPACVGPTGYTRMTQGDIGYGAGGANGAARTRVDLTQWVNIWGFNSTTGTTPAAWPGPDYAGPVLRAVNKHSFISAHFNTGSTPSTESGNYVYGTNPGGPNVDMTVSTTCGDFGPNSANSACVNISTYSDDQPRMFWTRGSSPPTVKCNLQPNTDYWLNIKYSDPTSNVECAGTSCPMFMAHYH